MVVLDHGMGRDAAIAVGWVLSVEEFVTTNHDRL